MNLFKNKVQIIERKKLIDDRGWFLKTMHGKEERLTDRRGETYVTLATPGAYRANHYHNIANEWFTILQGKAIAIFEDIKSKERVVIEMDSDKPISIFCEPRVAHVFYNKQSNTTPFILQAYSDLIYDPADTIPFDLTQGIDEL